MSSLSSFAPVLIVTYDRLTHLRKTITSLKNNTCADKTDLFVASDYPRCEAESANVDAVRSYLETVEGFKSLNVFVRETNLGVVQNCGLAVQHIFDTYDRIIIMNDDLVTAPGYLQFINGAFEKYGTHKSVFSITGYCPPIEISKSYEQDAFFLPRMSAWGCGLTKERYESIRVISQVEFDEFAADRKLSREFTKSGGKDLMAMLERVADGSLEAWDVCCMYTQFLKHQFTVYPSKSLVQNIGFDGTGLHCSVSDRFDVELSDKTTFIFPDEPSVDPHIVKANLKFRNGNWFKNSKVWVTNKTRGLIRRLFG